MPDQVVWTSQASEVMPVASNVYVDCQCPDEVMLGNSRDYLIIGVPRAETCPALTLTPEVLS